MWSFKFDELCDNSQNILPKISFNLKKQQMNTEFKADHAN